MTENPNPSISNLSNEKEVNTTAAEITNNKENTSIADVNTPIHQMNREININGSNPSETNHVENQDDKPILTDNEPIESNDVSAPASPSHDHFEEHSVISDYQANEGDENEEERELTDIEELPNYTDLNKAQLIALVLEAKEKPLEEASQILKVVAPFLDAIVHEEFNNALQKFIEEGGEKADFEYHDKDKAKEIFNKAFKDIKHKRAEEKARHEGERVENLNKKEAILEQIRQLTEGEETEGSLRKLKDLQNEWKRIRNVPKEHVERLWESYHILIHNFYDRLSMFNELKDLDRKKNLDQKIELTRKVAELALEPSAKRALIQLKKYQEEWRSIGPVPKESNDDIWARFRQESDKIFEMIRSVQDDNQKVREANLAAKKELLAKALEISNFTGTRIKDWFDQNTIANQLMEDWRKIGMVPLKYRESVWNEFRNARNQFFANKNTFFKQLHGERNENLKLKTGLCEKAEAIANNPIDLARQTDELKRLQEAWKKIGPVNERFSETIWKRFRTACDQFFEKKAQHYASQVEEQKKNLENKKGIIAKLEDLVNRDNDSNIINELKDIQEEWNNAGFVPLSEKESINKLYSELNDKAFNKFKGANKELREIKEKSHLEVLANSPNGEMKIKREEKMLYERIRGMRSDMSTWENNLGFFTKSSNSKTENPMVKQIEEKISAAAKQITVMEERLKSVRSFLKQVQKA